ncbi:MAG: PAS domain-containing protein [Microscillaceae bacterium]|jgi:PAS domain S-box-containing protein|nr:PAS domain-containing protein [Microscillaceae bacterium]
MKVLDNSDKYRNILEQNNLLLVLQANQGIQYVNPNFCQLADCQANELLNVPFLELLSDYHSGNDYPNINEHLVQGKVWEGELNLQNPRQHTFWVYITISPIFSAQGAISEFIIYGKSLDARKKQEYTLKRFRKALDQSSEMIFMVRAEDAVFLDVNDTVCDKLEYPREELIGKRVMDIDVDFPVRNSEEWQAHLQEIQKMPNQTLHIQTKHLTKTKKIIPVEGVLRYAEYENEKFVIGVFKDLSQKLQNEAYLNTLADNLDFSVWIINQNYELVVFNEAYANDHYIFFGEIPYVGFSFAPESIKIRPNAIEYWYRQTQRALKGEKFVDNLYIQEKYYEIAFNPIKIEQEMRGVSISARDITIAKTAELKILQANRKLEEMQDLAHLGYWSFDLASQKIEWSKQIYASFGLDPNLPPPDFSTYQTLIHPQDLPILLQSIQNTIEQGQSYEVEARHRQPDGTYKWILAKGIALKNEKGAVIGLEGSNLDTDALKRSQEIIQQNEVNLQAILNNTENRIWLIDRDLCLVAYNKPYQIIHEEFYGEKPYLGFDLKRVPPHVDGKFFTRNYRKAFAGEKIVEELAYNQRHYEVSFYPVVKDNEVVEISIYSKDITDRKQTEQQIAQSKATLEEVQSFAKLGFWQFDLFTQKIEWSAQTFLSLGYEPNQISLDKITDFQNLVHPEDLEKVYNSIVKSVQKDIEVEYEVRFLQKDGNYRWYLTKCRTLKDQNQKPIALQGTTLDIHKRKEIENALQELLENEKKLNEELSAREESLTASEEELRQVNQVLTQTNDELTKANAELDRFVYSASHDLRAPIASVLGLISLCRMTEDVHKIYEYLRLQEVSIRRLDSFIRDILDYSQNTRLEVKKESINFKNLVKETFEQYSFLDNFNEIEKIIEIEQEERFFSDTRRLSIVLNNLISNAIRYSKLPQAQPFVRLKAAVKDRRAYLEIQDNGIGIEEEHQSKIFEMFYRATTHKSGSGLGLYIVKEAIQKLQGEIHLTSAAGQGTLIKIELPDLRG